jgi:hypothetical protein
VVALVIVQALRENKLDSSPGCDDVNDGVPEALERENKRAKNLQDHVDLAAVNDSVHPVRR